MKTLLPRNPFRRAGAPPIPHSAPPAKPENTAWRAAGQSLAAQFWALQPRPHAIAVAAGTAGLHLSLQTAHLQPGDEVILSPLADRVVLQAVLQTGATPVLADVDATTGTIAPRAILDQLTARTRVILATHVGGQPCALDAIAQIVRDNKLVLLEDCSQAIAATYKGQPVGTFGDAAWFDLGPRAGGLVVLRQALDAPFTANADWSPPSASHPVAWCQAVPLQEIGPMMPPQVAIARTVLAQRETDWHRRQTIWHRWQTAWADCPLVPPSPLDTNSRHSYAAYPLRLDPTQTDCTLAQLRQAIATVPLALPSGLTLPDDRHWQHRYGWQLADYPQAQAWAATTLWLPLSATLPASVVEAVGHAVRQLFPSR